MAIKSQGITLSWNEGAIFPAISTDWAESYQDDGKTTVELTNLLEIPEIGAPESSFEQIDITTLADSKFVYMNGLENIGEPEAVEFRFLYEKEQFRDLEKGGVMAHGVAFGEDGYHVHMWTITLPDGSTCKFIGKPSVRLEGVGVNAAVTYVLSITPDGQYGEFKWDFPAATDGE